MNPTLFWTLSAAALVYFAVRILGLEGAVLTALVLCLLHLVRPRGQKRRAPSRSGSDDMTADLSAAASPLEIELGEELDLHTFAPSDVRDLVDTYLEESRKKGYAVVRIVHGKGKGVQREIVRSLLARHPAVESFGDAPQERGGWGATLVRLKPV